MSHAHHAVTQCKRQHHCGIESTSQKHWLCLGELSGTWKSNCPKHRKVRCAEKQGEEVRTPTPGGRSGRFPLSHIAHSAPPRPHPGLDPCCEQSVHTEFTGPPRGRKRPAAFMSMCTADG